MGRSNGRRSRRAWQQTAVVACAALGTLVLGSGTLAQGAVLPPQGHVLWLKGDTGTFQNDAGTIVAGNGQTVERWDDITDINDAGHDANGLNNPTRFDGVANGYPVVRFDGEPGTDRMALFTPLTTDPDQWTIFAVYKQDAGVTAQDHVFTHRNSGTELIQASVEGSNARLQLRGSGGTLVDFSAGGVNNGAFNVTMWQFDTINDRHAISVNGGAEVVNTFDFGAQTFNADTQRIGYFFNGSASGGFFDGDIAELFVYNRALTGVEKTLVGHYLESKYGIETGYAGGVFLDYGTPGQQVQTGFQGVDVTATSADVVTTVLNPFKNGEDLQVTLSSNGQGMQGRDRAALSNTEINGNNLVDDLVFNSGGGAGSDELVLTLGGGGTALNAGAYQLLAYFNDSFFSSTSGDNGLSDNPVDAFIGINDGTPDASVIVSDFRSSNPTDMIAVLELLLVANGTDPITITFAGVGSDQRFAFNGFALVRVVPEPGSAALLGALALGTVARRRRSGEVARA